MAGFYAARERPRKKLPKTVTVGKLKAMAARVLKLKKVLASRSATQSHAPMRTCAPAARI